MSYSGEERRRVEYMTEDKCSLVHQQSQAAIFLMQQDIHEIKKHIIGNGTKGILTRLSLAEDWMLNSKGWRATIIALVISVGMSAVGGFYIAGGLANQINVNSKRLDEVEKFHVQGTVK